MEGCAFLSSASALAFASLSPPLLLPPTGVEPCLRGWRAQRSARVTPPGVRMLQRARGRARGRG
eukprot:3860566-Rhodomonas_salina.1